MNEEALAHWKVLHQIKNNQGLTVLKSLKYSLQAVVTKTTASLEKVNAVNTNFYG